MSEGLLSAVATQLSAGAMLRNAREAAGLPIGALAASLRVPERKLQALEDDRFDLLPDLVFVRALAASVCRNLHIEAAPVLAKMPQIGSPHLAGDASGINVPFRGDVGAAGALFGDRFSKPLVLLALALVLGVVLLTVFNYADHSSLFAGAKSELQQPAPVPVALPVPVSAPLVVAAPSAAASLVAAAPDPAASAAPVTVEGSGLSTGTLVFKTRGASWVEVVDGAGVVQLRKLLRAGETTGVSGVMPLRVVIGRADTTEVQVLGKPYDLAPVAKDNVARFEVK